MHIFAQGACADSIFKRPPEISSWTLIIWCAHIPVAFNLHRRREMKIPSKQAHVCLKWNICRVMTRVHACTDASRKSTGCTWFRASGKQKEPYLAARDCFALVYILYIVSHFGAINWRRGRSACFESCNIIVRVVSSSTLAQRQTRTRAEALTNNNNNNAGGAAHFSREQSLNI